jgi:hypothetical protein
MRLAGRCVFFTADGIVGVGPASLQSGDTVTIIHGCRLPLILRPRGRDYRLLGTAYVHGAMRGEYANGMETEFTLK